MIITYNYYNKSFEARFKDKPWLIGYWDTKDEAYEDLLINQINL